MEDVIQEFFNENKYIEEGMLTQHIEESLDAMELLEEIQAGEWFITKVPNGFLFRLESNQIPVFVPK